MFEDFENFIISEGEFTKEELKRIRSLAVVRKVKRRQLLLQEGEVCQYKMFVTKGLVKAYILKNDGIEHIMRFAAENTWITDGESLEKGTPSRTYIEALEPTEIVMWAKHALDELVDAVPGFKKYFAKLIANSLYASHDRILMNISATSEEKYQEFITTYPDIFNRVPLHMVASYLGVSRETLSRIRHAQLKQQ